MRAYHWLQRVWYGSGRGGWLLIPLSWLFAVVAGARRGLYALGVLRTARLDCPVVIIGNLAVGGTGKTPLTLWLAERLSREGLRVGIASRGYGGSGGRRVRLVQDDDEAAEVGDEPLMMARRGVAPVAVARRRVAAARRLASRGVDLVLCDDGLQHYALARDYEIAVIDGARRFGNGRLLPAGPLREPRSRLAGVNRVVCNGGDPGSGEIGMRLEGRTLYRLGGSGRARLEEFRGRRCHGVAGIGHPERFFALLRDAGIDLVAHPLADHAPACLSVMAIGQGEPVLMTEKDAVKCRDAGPFEAWYLPVQAALGAGADRMIDDILGLCSTSRPCRGGS